MGITTKDTKPRAGLRSFLLRAYAFGFCNDCIFIYSWYAVMFADHGLSAAQISILFAVWSTVAFALEIPSGALADKYSRRHVIAFSQMVRIAGYACWALWPTFWGFLIGFVCWGIKSAFVSGAFEALVYDELKRYGAESDYARLIGRIGACANVGILISAAIAAPMLRLGYPAIILASLVPLAISCIAVLTISPSSDVGRSRFSPSSEDGARGRSVSESHYLHILREGIREAVHNRAVLRIIVFLSFALVFAGTLDEYWTLFFTTAAMPKPGIGVLCVVLTAVQTFAAAIAHRFSRLPDTAFYAGYLVCGGLLLAAAYVMRPICAVLLLAFAFISEITGVVVGSELQHSISGEARATVTSVKGFAENVACVVLFLSFGGIAHKCGYRGGFMAFGGAMMLIGAVYVAWERRAAAR